MDKGIYCLVFYHRACSTIVGALGTVAFPAGFHIYIGSALGSGGLKRLARHCRLACGEYRRPKWHVDYILTDRRFPLVCTVSAPTTERLECRLAEILGGEGIKGFGCSDCTCRSHLLYRHRDPKEEIVAAFGVLGLPPSIKTMITQYVEGNI